MKVCFLKFYDEFFKQCNKVALKDCPLLQVNFVNHRFEPKTTIMMLHGERIEEFKEGYTRTMTPYRYIAEGPGSEIRQWAMTKGQYSIVSVSLRGPSKLSIREGQVPIVMVM